MPIAVTCPGCSTRMQVPDTVAGKMIKCPKCQGIVAVPAPAPAVSETDADERRSKARAKTIVEDDEKPRKKAKVAFEDDEDDRPTKKKKKKRSEDDEGNEGNEGNSRLVRNIIGAVLLVIMVGLAGYVFYDKFGRKETEKDKDEGTASTTPSTPSTRPNVMPNGPPNSSANSPPNGTPGRTGGMPGGPPNGTSGAPNTSTVPNSTVVPNPPAPDPVGMRWRETKIALPALSVDRKFLLGVPKATNLSVCVWELATARLVVSVSSERDLFDGYNVSPDGSQVAVVSQVKKKLTLWGIPGGKAERTIDLSVGVGKLDALTPDKASKVTYSRDGKAVLALIDGVLIRVDVAAGTETVLQRELTGAVRFCPGTDLVVDVQRSGPSGRGVLVLDTTRPDAPKFIPVKPDEDPSQVDASADGRTIVAAVIDRSEPRDWKTVLNVYDAASGELKSSVPVAGVRKTVRNVRLNADGTRLFFCVDGELQGGACWVSDLKTPTARKLVAPGTEGFRWAEFVVDKKTVAVTGSTSKLHIYDVDADKEVTP
jgi:hypothetical protein